MLKKTAPILILIRQNANYLLQKAVTGSGGTENHARRTSRIQDTVCSFRSHHGYPDLPVHDVLPACRYLDPACIMDADRSGCLCRIWNQTQQAGTRKETPQRRQRSECHGTCTLRTEYYHRIMAPADHRMERRQDTADHFFCFRIYALRLLYVANF